ncbi:uncharacterized protein LOC111015544 isoform X2 [Momordica charantia]|uniref:Uncharacterized protein LOC111015544 isoform X2 n=1 Tax=Momordica charantia TaxID=3673 RepID=A0A6J1CXR9_MOMCH|nr:uncharacterized protein LOC111015544 isoform X2 [Momordica charantia]
MGFFDLNIPYDEHSSSPSSRANRIRIVAKLMELGYSGIAYNRTIKGVMSDQDRCSIPLLNASSLHNILPSFSASVEFHREILGVPRSSPFRQYTRLTICLNSLPEVLAVNSGNILLKTYDLIAVKPLNQHAFEQACEKLEIDIIAIDFAEKLPFRLKQGLIKSAIQRGVYFELMYSDLLLDVHERRQMISTAKLLVDWTKGKNLILSSAASSVNEIRGPYDVANLSSLLGVSMERAKAAVSKNCRNLIANALKRKQFYKETIRVERISSNDKLDPNDPWSVDLFKWDPIASGEGDLLLDDMAKSFAASNKESKNVKAIDFTSVIDNMPPQGFLVKNVISDSEVRLSLNDNRDSSHVADVIEPPVAENGVIQQSHPLDGEHCSISSDCRFSVIESFEILPSHGDAGKLSSNSEEEKSTVEEIVQPKTSMQEEPIEMEIDNVQPQNLLSSSELNVATTDELAHSPTSTRDVLAVVSGNDGEETFKMPEDVDSHQNKYALESSDILSGSENMLRDQSLSNLVSENQKNMSTVIDDTFTAEECLLGTRLGEPEDQVSSLGSCSMSDIKDDYLISTRQQQISQVLTEEQKCEEADPQITRFSSDQPLSGVMSTGKNRAKRRRQHPALKLPFKRLINPLAFKKVRKIKCYQ